MITLSSQDKAQLLRKGISGAELQEQLDCFRKGFPYLKVAAAASKEKGIFAPDAEAAEGYLERWDAYREAGHRIVKFVPASGAASRMFKALFAFLGADYDTPQTDDERRFFDRLPRAAFFADLDAACRKLYQTGATELADKGEYKKVLAALLGPEGLNYGHLPKGLLKFHSYPDGSRTPAEEHLVEGARYARMADGSVHLHFTVSPEHVEPFRTLLDAVKPKYEAELNVKFDISFSLQKGSTDAVAVDMENRPFRNADGSLLFRPGGHGALIENLNDLDGDVVFIKNIDNVVPDRLKEDTVRYKQLLAGILVDLQAQAFRYLQILDSGCYDMEQLREMLYFVQQKFCCKNPDTKQLEDTELAIYLRRKLNRPIRVCGMVKNVGEPGGGPFLAYNPDGTISPQILESSQIDMDNPEMRQLFEQGTHFNPVDLVCGIKDYQGRKFNLLQYVDRNTGFISHKSKEGRDLKALERPGLWNGAMSDWNTVFVEVPLTTFNPVKTVNDLFRPEHQPEP